MDDLSVEQLKLLGRGTYTIIFSLNNDVEVKVGRLGQLFFRRGLYSYTGSALGPSNLSLYYRVLRHISRSKRLWWHIDYLLTRRDSEVLAVVAAPTTMRFECKISAALSTLEGVRTIRGFGSSDCSCIGHLHYYVRMSLDEILKIVSSVYDEFGLLCKVIILC